MKTIGILLILFFVIYITFDIKKKSIQREEGSEIEYIPKRMTYKDQIDSRIIIELEK